MSRIASLLVFSTVFSMLALAGSWSGKLLDANCYDQQKQASACSATSETTAFALDAAGKIYKLDAAGNSKASEALKNRADRATDPAKPQSKEVMAQVTGTEQDGTIAVESIEVR